MDLIMLPIDDFNVILVIDFLVEKKAIPISAINSLLMIGGQTGMVLGQRKQLSNSKFLSALQFKKEFRRKEPSYIALVVTKKRDSNEPTPSTMIETLKSFGDVMLANLSRNLPPQQHIDYKNELIPGVKPPVKAPYWMATSKLAKLQKQLT